MRKKFELSHKEERLRCKKEKIDWVWFTYFS